MEGVDMTGRPPTPTVLKRLAGTNRKDRTRNEPKPQIVRPACPPELVGVARKEWGRIAKQLAALSLLTVVDRTALAAYCVAYAQWIGANEALAKPVEEGGGMIIYTQNGYPLLSPHWTASQQAAKAVLSFLREFGMTPASRSRLSVNNSEKLKTLNELLDEAIDEQ